MTLIGQAGSGGIDLPEYSVMVVEDEPLILRSLMRNIHSCGIGFKVVFSAANGEEALGAIRVRPPDVVFSDVRMPILDGIRLMQIVEEEYPFIQKVIVSAFADFSYAQTAIQSNVVGYLTKPVTREDVMGILLKCKIALDKQSVSTQARIRSAGKKIPVSQLVLLLREYLKNHYMDDIDIGGLVSQYHVNVDYLSRMFTKSTGVSPSKYLIRLRINKALQLINDGNLSVKEVGSLVGYQDQGYFSRIFKSVTGYSPSQIRDSLDELPEHEQK